MSSPSDAVKVCKKCGTDCAGKPRTKDAKGNYYCQPCYQALTAKKHSEQTPAQSAPRIDRAPRPAPTDDSFGFAADESNNMLDHLLAMTPAAPSVGQPCTNCGTAMKADGVICTNCGFNRQTGATLGKTKIAKVKKTRSGGAGAAGWPIPIGIISIVFGGGGVLLNGLNLVVSLMNQQENQGTSYSIGRLGGAGLMISLSLWLLTSGIGILKRNESAVASIKKWAVVKASLSTLCLGSLFAITMMGSSAASSRGGSTPELEALGDMMALVLFGTWVWLMAWPGFVLFWFSRATVQSEVDRWN